MSEPKFMHGPWHFAGSGIIANDDDEEIGLSAVYDDDPNGKLILAAPEMYEAVRRLVAYADSIGHTPAECAGDDRCFYCPARAALAKVSP